MDRPDLLSQLSRLRRAQVGNQRVPHKPLLLLWLFGRFATTGTTLVSYQDAEEPVSRLINDFGPPVASPSRARQRAAMPFVHLERELWDLRDGRGHELGPEVPERRSWLVERSAVGRLRPEVEQLLADPATLAAAARQLLDLHFTPALASLICDAVDLDVATLEAASLQPPIRGRRPRRPGFAEEVLRAYAYACAVCGFDGALGRNPVAIEAAHIRWHSQQGPDEVANALALCTLHHALLDLGVLGLNVDLQVLVSPLYVARSAAGHVIHTLNGTPLRPPQPGQPTPAAAHVNWHGRLVFKATPPRPNRSPAGGHQGTRQPRPPGVGRLRKGPSMTRRSLPSSWSDRGRCWRGIRSGGVCVRAAGVAGAGGRVPSAGLGGAARRPGPRDRPGRTDLGPHPQRAIGLTGIRAYPTGFGCSLHLREVIPGEQSNFGAFNMFGDGVDPAGEFADYYLRFGVGFADGRKATNLEQRHDFGEGPAPDPPTLRLVRWEGYDRLAWEVDVWVWGLPPPGALAFVCEWPARGIPETRAEIDAGLVLEAAARAVPIWPDQPR